MIPGRGLLCLETQHPDDFGNTYVPWKTLTVDNYGNLLGHYNFPDWFGSRYHFYDSEQVEENYGATQRINPRSMRSN